MKLKIVGLIQASMLAVHEVFPTKGRYLHIGPNFSWLRFPYTTFLSSPFQTVSITIVVIICLYLYVSGNENVLVISENIDGGAASQTKVESTVLSKDEWVRTAMSSTIEISPPSIEAIGGVCAGVVWRDGLFMTCGRIWGGVGNVRNKILVCLRYAIEAGASVFVLPPIETRKNDEIEVIFTEEYLEFEYMFDTQNFIASLESACPQMKVLRPEEFERNYSNADRASIFETSQKLGDGLVNLHHIRHPERWRKNFEFWLKSAIHDPPSATHPVIVEIDSPFMDWPVAYDPPSFAPEFGQLLRFQENARELAAIVLYELSQYLFIDPRHGLTRNAYYGAHLRTEQDAAKAGFMDFETQTKMYLESAEQHNLSTIYVSCGSTEEIERFRDQARGHGIDVQSKDTLLKGEDLDRLLGMTFDQRGLVDYEMMLKSSMFGGIDSSTFALNIGIRRHCLLNDTVDEYGPQRLTDHNRWLISDGLSQVAVDHGYNPGGWSYYLGMWP